MNKAELIAAVAEKTDMTKKDSEKAVNAAIEAVIAALADEKDGKVQIAGFGTFEAKNRPERIGRNPQTREEVKIPATRVAGFKAGKALKEAVAK